MSETPKAIFLSYASQDADAARRVCEALRAAGLEVWFDQSELRGGDAWDAAIRKQVKECALFVPLVSANTDARSEGYFRREASIEPQPELHIRPSKRAKYDGVARVLASAQRNGMRKIGFVGNEQFM